MKLQLECIKVSPSAVEPAPIVKEADRTKTTLLREDVTFQDAGDAKSVPPRPRQTVRLENVEPGQFLSGLIYDIDVVSAKEADPRHMAPAAPASVPPPEPGSPAEAAEEAKLAAAAATPQE